jgi:hypothetical protein
MNRETMHPQAGPAAGPAPPPAASLPDINAETYPFETVQRVVDQAAWFNLFSLPRTGGSDVGVPLPGRPGNGIGFWIDEVLHRFEVALPSPSRESGVRVVQSVGEAVASFRSRWMIVPPDFRALPDREPPPVAFDPSLSQRFAMCDAVCSFGDGGDGFRGFGTGVTWPSTSSGGPRVLAAAIGTLLEGFGRFRGREGTYTYCGTLSPEGGFRGQLLCRVIDPAGELQAREVPPLREVLPDPDPGATYLLVRGQKRGRSDKTAYRFGAGGLDGFDVQQDLHRFDLGCAVQGGVRAARNVGPVVGRMTSSVTLNLLNPGAPGTALSPIPFSAFNTYTFQDAEGRAVGGFAADGSEGRTFNVRFPSLPGQQALRFAGFGPILDGTGVFQGLPGLLTDNSLTSVSPHVLSTLYVVRFEDPEGRLRAPRG